MTTQNRFRWPLLLTALCAFITAPVAAQSPNTASLVVVVVDQNGAVQEMQVLSKAFSSEFGWTSGPALKHRHQVGH